MRPDIDTRFANLGPTDQAAVLHYLEYLEWKRDERPAVQDEARIALSSAIAARLRAVRTTLGKTEEEAAEAAGIFRLSTYLTYETRGPRRWSAAKMRRYCEAWNVSIDWLYTGEGSMFRGAPPVSAKAAGQSRTAPTVVRLSDFRSRPRDGTA